MERIIVTTAGSPSGMAATARAIAEMNVLSAVFPSSSHEKGSLLSTSDSTRPTANTTTHIAITSFVRNFESSAIFF